MKHKLNENTCKFGELHKPFVFALSARGQQKKSNFGSGNTLILVYLVFNDYLIIGHGSAHHKSTFGVLKISAHDEVWRPSSSHYFTSLIKTADDVTSPPPV